MLAFPDPFQVIAHVDIAHVFDQYPMMAGMHRQYVIFSEPNRVSQAQTVQMRFVQIIVDNAQQSTARAFLYPNPKLFSPTSRWNCMTSDWHQAVWLFMAQYGLVGRRIAGITPAIDLCIWVNRKATGIESQFHEVSRPNAVAQPGAGYFKAVSVQSMTLHTVDQFISVGKCMWLT